MNRSPTRTKKSPARQASGKKSGTKKAAASADLLDGLANRVEKLGIESLSFQNQYAFPCLVKKLPLTGRERKVVLDFHVVSISEDHFVLDLIDDGKFLTLSVILPDAFLDRARLQREYMLQGDRDVLVATHDEVLEDIQKHYGRGHLKKPISLSSCPLCLPSVSPWWF